MFPMLPLDVPGTMRDSLVGARAGDPILPERRRAPRRAIRVRLAVRRGRRARRPAPATQSS
jgi:hypothetical protein